MFAGKIRNLNGKVMNEYHYGAGVNNIDLKSAFASFAHTKVLYDVKCAYCRIKIKAEKSDEAAENSFSIDKDPEEATCRLFADSVAEYCFRNGFQNYYHTYGDMNNRYFLSDCRQKSNLKMRERLGFFYAINLMK